MSFHSSRVENMADANVSDGAGVAAACDGSVEAAAAKANDSKVKIQGSLGKVEAWALQLASLKQTVSPSVGSALCITFVASHGVSRAHHEISTHANQGPTIDTVVALGAVGAEGFRGGVNVLAGAVGVDNHVVDVGIDCDPAVFEGLSSNLVTVDRVRGPTAFSGNRGDDGSVGVFAGTEDLAEGPAMSGDQVLKAIQAGKDAVDRAVDGGSYTAICIGEAGIGNTTAASALIAAYTGSDASVTVGPGTGIDAEAKKVKTSFVRSAVERLTSQPQAPTPTAILAEVGGFEIAAMAGAMMQCWKRKTPCVVDGFISCSAALIESV